MNRRLRCALSMLLITSMLLLVTGCWNRRELNEVAIAVGIGLDKVGSNYKLTVQVVDAGAVAPNKGGGKGAPVTLYQMEAESIYEAFRRMTTITARRIYPSHLRILVIGEELAKEGIAPALDLLSRDWELRSDFYMAVAKGDVAENVLKVLTPIEQIPANMLYNSLTTSERLWAPTKVVRLDDFITDYLSDGHQPVLSGIRISGDAEMMDKKEFLDSTLPAARLQYANLAVFKDDRIIGWLNEVESKGFNYITDNVNNTVGPISCPDGKGVINVEIIRTSTKMKGAVRNGKPVIDLTVYTQENIGEISCSYDISNQEQVKKLEEVAAVRTKQIMEMAVRKVQKTFKSDIFGFGDAIHRADKDYWKKNKAKWEQIFPTVEVNYNAKIRIRQTGTTNNSFLQAKKKGSP